MGILDKQRAREKEKKLKIQQLKEAKKAEKEAKKAEEKRLIELKILKKSTDLSEDELKYLIKNIVQSKFDGLEMQIIYSITAKLQNQLKNLTEWRNGKK